MSDVSITVTGFARVQERLAALAEEFGEAVGNAVRAESEIIMTEAKRRTPVLTGALRESGNVTGPDGDGDVVLGFGGPATPYAVYVHENLEAYHRVGRAKFLESAVMDALPNLADRVGRRVRR